MWMRTLLTFMILMPAVPGAAAGSDQIPTLGIGKPAPDFRLPGVDGKTYGLEDFSKAEILVIVFTCNHCPTAQAYEKRIMQLASDYQNRNVVLVAISPNDPQAIRLDELGYSDVSDTLEEMKLRAKERGFNFPYLYDGDQQEASRAYGPGATPQVFIFDRQRMLRYTGRIDDNEKAERAKTREAQDAIEALLAGRPVPVEETKVFGCSVKWSDNRDSVRRAFEAWSREEVSLELIEKAGVQELVKNDSPNLLLINVWATWCGPCVAEFPELVAINRMYRQREFEMITISADSSDQRDAALAFLKKQQASTRNYLFDTDDVYILIDTLDSQWRGVIPYTILIEPGGNIRFRQEGIIDPLEVKKAIVDYLGRYYK